jgi:hypothetical protein
MKRTRIAVVALTAAALFGCDKKDGPAPATSGSAATQASAIATAASAGIIGLDAPGNDPTIVAAVKKAIGCKWMDEGYFESSCPDRKDFNELKNPEKQLPTLISLVEDTRPGVRFLGAELLYRLTGFAKDKPLAERLVAAAEKLPADDKGSTANKIGRSVGFVDVTATGLFDRIKALLTKADAPEKLRLGIANWLLPGNQDSEPAYTLTLEQAKSGATPRIKGAALVALSAAYLKRPVDDMCKLWVDNLGDADEKVAALLAGHVTNGDLQVENMDVGSFPFNWQMVHSDENKCPPAAADAALKEFDKRAKGAGFKESLWMSVFRGVGKSKNATPEQKKQALALAKAFVENTKASAYQRGLALESIALLDPPGAKAYIQKFETDKDLKDNAGRTLKNLDSAADKNKGKGNDDKDKKK